MMAERGGSRGVAGGLRAAAAAAWAALPGDVLGRMVMAGCGIEAESRRVIVPGAGEVRLVEDPRTDRYLSVMPIRPAAQTVGRYVFSRDPLPDLLVRHESEHVVQWRRWGPLFLPAYLAASLVAWLRGEGAYQGNWFEREARAREPLSAGAAPAGPG